MCSKVFTRKRLKMTHLMRETMGDPILCWTPRPCRVRLCRVSWVSILSTGFPG